MIEDLLFIAKNLLIQVDSLDLTEEEKDYIIKVIIKIIFVLLIEYNKVKLLNTGIKVGQV